MADGQIDPARLDGEALRRWYMRTPDELERERSAASEQEHQDFFAPLRRGAPASAPATPAIANSFPSGGSQSGLTTKDPTSETRDRSASKLDPSRTDVFQPGPDGKLHAIPGWHTTGPLDFGVWSHNVDWGGVANDLVTTALGSATFLDAGLVAEKVLEGLRYKVGQDVIRGIVQGHHADPKFMGGAKDQLLAPTEKVLHKLFHDELREVLTDAGFPPIGGPTGSGEHWAEFFRPNPAKKDEAIGILKDVTARFDRRNGTKISKYLDHALSKRNAPP